MLWQVRFSHGRRGSASSSPRSCHGAHSSTPPRPAPPKQFSLPLPGFAVRGNKARTGAGGSGGGEGRLVSPGLLEPAASEEYLFQLLISLYQSRNMYGAEILINPRSAADQSAAAQRLLLKGAGDAKGSCRIWAWPFAPGQDCLYPLLPYPKGSEATGKPGTGQHPGGSTRRHTPCPSLVKCRCPGEPHF